MKDAMRQDVSHLLERFNERFTARQRVVLLALGVLLVMCVTGAVAKVMNRDAAIRISVPRGSAFENTPLVALDSGAKSKIVRGKAAYKFTQKQVDGIAAFVSQYKDAALTLVVRRETAERGGEFTLCFTGSTEEPSPLVTCDMAQGPRFRLTLSFGKDNEGKVVIPTGFCVTAEGSCVEDAVITRASLGYDKTGDTPHFAFSAAGGKVDMNAEAADFSAGSVLFPTQNGLVSSDGVMPKIIIKLEEGTDDINGVKGALNFGGEQFTLWRYKGVDSLAVYAASLKMPFNTARVEGVKATAIMMVSSEEELLPVQGKAFDPYKTDPGFIISWPESTWRTRDYELFEWDRFPKVLFMDFRNYEVQSAFLRRLAFYTEKEGYRGTLASDDVLQDKHDYNAHDYRDESMAAFYTLAERENFPLNDSEMLLRDILLHNEVIKEDGQGYVAGGGALITISKQSEPWLRDRLLSHEGWHGIYFTNERFRNAVAAVYGTIDSTSRDFLEQYWGTQEGLGYDTSDEYLTQNEFMAYLMQQRLADTAGYFVHLANRGSVMRGIPELAEYVRNTGGRAFEDAAKVLNEYAADNFGLACGRISLVR